MRKSGRVVRYHLVQKISPVQLVISNCSYKEGLKDIQWLKSHFDTVEATYSQRFKAEKRRFKDWKRLVKRYTQAVTHVLEHRTTLSAVDEAHNELSIAYALLQHSNQRFSSICYEPRLPHCAKSIDFRAVVAEEETVFIDVKTIKPKDKDRWEQYEKVQKKKLVPENVEFILQEDWCGGKLWHNRFSSRSSMLKYALELEGKIRECKLSSEKTLFVLMFCGEGFYWREDQLEDFVEFYTTGRNRQDDRLRNMEVHHIAEKQIVLSQEISGFACMIREQGDVDYRRVNWNIQPPQDPFPWS